MKITDFLICDDIRIEIGNKVSIMGVYGDSILLSAQGVETTWPIPLRLGVYARFRFDADDQRPDHFRLQIRHETNEIAAGEGVIQIQDPTKPFALAMPIPMVLIPAPGYLHFQIILSKGSRVIFDQEMGQPLAINRP